MGCLVIGLFALAVSSDGFVVGLAYGIRKIKIPLLSLLVICVASAGSVTLAMLLGRGLSTLLQPEMASRVGALTIIAIGLFFLMQLVRDRIGAIEENGDYPLLSFKIKPLGVIIQILKEPSTADFDRSGEIGIREAFFLGLALAMDAFGAGIGISLAGYNILFTALSVGVLKFLLVSGGLILGRKVTSDCWEKMSSGLTVLILLTIGILELIR